MHQNYKCTKITLRGFWTKHFTKSIKRSPTINRVFPPTRACKADNILLEVTVYLLIPLPEVALSIDCSTASPLASLPAAKHPLLTVSNWLLPYWWIHLYLPSQVCSKKPSNASPAPQKKPAPALGLNAKIMKPAPLQLQLKHVHNYITHIYTRWQFAVSLKFRLSPAKSKKKRRFKCVISTSIYTHNGVDPHYHSISNVSRHVWRSRTKITDFPFLPLLI